MRCSYNSCKSKARGGGSIFPLIHWAEKEKGRREKRKWSMGRRNNKGGRIRRRIIKKKEKERLLRDNLGMQLRLVLGCLEGKLEQTQ